VLWLVGFDIIYATQDYEFDRSFGLRSLVVRWGLKNALGVAFLAHLFMWGLLVMFGVLNAFRFAYWIGLILILGLLVFEHVIARRRSLSWVNLAFFKLNAVISMIFVSVTTVEVVFPWFRLRWY
jgi:4-hydroxybenzoate polyprenyltransferase